MKKIFEFLDENSKASTMRLMSVVMLFVAIFYLFYSFNLAVKNIDDMTVNIVLLLTIQNGLNFAYAFFPKVIQKKFEELNIKDLKQNV